MHIAEFLSLWEVASMRIQISWGFFTWVLQKPKQVWYLKSLQGDILPTGFLVRASNYHPEQGLLAYEIKYRKKVTAKCASELNELRK